MALAQYSELFWFPSGALATDVPARVFQHATNTLAPLYADAGGTTPLANPVRTSAAGRLEFWAEEGSYWVHIDSEAFEIAVGAAAQAATQQDITDEVARADAAYAALAHAARHASAGVDPVTVAQSQVTGLAAALAALLPLAGGTMSGTVTNNVGAATTPAFGGGVTGDTFDRWRILANGTFEAGPGSAGRDTNWRRSAANEWTTDDSVIVSLTLRHLGSLLGFYGAAAVAKQTVSGSWADGSAGASLAAALATIGLITNNTTA